MERRFTLEFGGGGGEKDKEQAVAPISGGKYEEIISYYNRSALNTLKTNFAKDDCKQLRNKMLCRGRKMYIMTVDIVVAQYFLVFPISLYNPKKIFLKRQRNLCHLISNQ